MESHPNDHPVQETSLGALQNLLFQNQRNKKIFISNSGIRQVLASVSSHPNIPSMAVFGSGLLRNVSADANGASAVVQQGGLEGLTQVIKSLSTERLQTQLQSQANRNHQVLQDATLEHSCAAICNLLEANVVPKPAVKALLPVFQTLVLDGREILPESIHSQAGAAHRLMKQISFN
jgi:hypothetical protein